MSKPRTASFAARHSPQRSTIRIAPGIALRIAVCAIMLLMLSSCAEQAKTTALDVALKDGSHAGGILLAVDYNWLVLDDGDASGASPLTLLDYDFVDTVTILGNHYQTAGAVLGGVIGSATGAVVGTRSSSFLGLGIGLVGGILAGYFIGDHFSDTDIVFAHPTDSNYLFLRSKALYPDTIPADLKFVLDSVDAADSINRQ